MRIGPAINLEALKLQQAQRAAAPGGDGEFAQQLTDVLKDVNDAQLDSQAKQQSFMTDQQVDYHDLMIAMERASTAMQLTIQVRNKLLEAYQEISRMQV